MAQGQGNQPINIDIMIEVRDDERRELLRHFLKDNELDEEEQRLLALHDQGTSRLEQVLHCIWTGMSWFRCLTPAGNRRTRELTAQYVSRYGERIAAD